MTGPRAAEEVTDISGAARGERSPPLPHEGFEAMRPELLPLAASPLPPLLEGGGTPPMRRL